MSTVRTQRMDPLASAARGPRETPELPMRGDDAQNGGASSSAESLETTIEELQVANEELRVQNDALAAAQEELAHARARYQELFDLAPDAYLVSLGSGSISEANAAAARLLNVPAAHLIGKPLANFVPEAARREFRAGLRRLAQHERLEGWQIPLRPRRGEPIDCIAHVAITRGPSGAVLHLRWLLRAVPPPHAP